ncbi:MAG: NAD(P)H-hydrate dehydratase [Oscillospiraceae bacterium]|nr:NAD(P)H-hydrate dehydratase [Oscillospiraceae bacterium]
MNAINYLVTPEQMQVLEKLTDNSGICYQEMMEQAGHALAMELLLEYPDCQKFLFLVGTGNNGGDCYVAGYYLKLKQKQVEFLAPMGEPKTEISKNAYNRVMKNKIPVKSEPDYFYEQAEIIIDGLFGTGFHGELPETLQKLLISENNQIHVACDIPSGGNGLTGQVSAGIFKADLTITFGAEKFGMSQYPLRSYCGKIKIADIGIPEQAFFKIQPITRLDLEQVKNNLPERKPDAYKNQFGHVLAVTGSCRMRGACVLAVTACMRAGAGLVTCASAEQALSAIAVRMPEIMCLPLELDRNGFFLNNMMNQEILKNALQNKQALLIGCGMGVTQETQNLTKFLLSQSSCPVILDADGLNCIASCIEYVPRGRTILTPHAGEAGRLLNISTEEVQKDRFHSAKKLAELTGAVVILKGAGTIITDGKQTSVCNQGNAGMAKAGSGDVLAGMTASFVAQGLDLYQSACTAVMLHAVAGDKTADKLPYYYMLPQDLIDSLKDIL